jgi:hypothetical protein
LKALGFCTASLEKARRLELLQEKQRPEFQSALATLKQLNIQFSYTSGFKFSGCRMPQKQEVSSGTGICPSKL